MHYLNGTDIRIYKNNFKKGGEFHDRTRKKRRSHETTYAGMLRSVLRAPCLERRRSIKCPLGGLHDGP